MTAGDLEALADRLMLGEFTTADLHAAARCARAWAALERRENCELFAYPKEKKWSFYPDLKHTWLRVPADTALDAVEAAEVGK